MCKIFQIQFRLGLLIATFSLVVSCLITNCPRGGKRAESIDEVKNVLYTESKTLYVRVMQCPPCGPDGQGVCISRNICCGPEIGCLTSSQHTKSCRGMVTFKSSCLLRLNAPSCGENGLCKTKYLCCVKNKCSLDMSCKLRSSVKYKDFNGSFLLGFLPFLQKSQLSRSHGSEQSQNNEWRVRNESTYSLTDYES